MSASAAAPSPFDTEAWRTNAGRHWLAQADRLEAMLAPVLEPLFTHAALRPGERVLDVGCGRGATARRAAAIVGPTGGVTAVAVAPDLIAAASAAPSASGAAPVAWLVADAQRAPLVPDGVDVVISRFGVMFFDDAVAAFANLAQATRPGGRLAVATWRPRDASPFQWAGHEAMVRALQAGGYEASLGETTAGPFTFGVEAHVRRVLGAAGWTQVAMHPVMLPLYVAGPGATADDAVELMTGMPGVATFLEPFGPAGRELAVAALRAVYAHHHDGAGVRMDAAVTVITARR